ncbi:MAG: hypothetical protein ABIS50_24915 [Luteolibacter sp.]|uniref:hypothetical protein n=1 Tax=Luteolibacter sp. TaxID=1962973 RepID=UPI003262EBBB
MTRKSIAILTASHLLVVAAGVLLARQAAPAGDAAVAENVLKHPDRGSPSGGAYLNGKTSSSRPPKEWHGSEFTRAWKAVKTAGLTTEDRVRTQRDLLKKWAEVDLASAIEAALGEEWDGDDHDYYNNVGPFLDVFADALAKNPQESWEMIRGRQFGLGTGMLRNVWIQSVGMKDPVFLATKAGDVSWRDKERLISSCLEGVAEQTDTSVRAKVFETLKSLPDEVVSLDELKNFLPVDGPSDPGAIKDEILRLQATDPRMAKLQAMMLGEALASKTTDEINTAIQDLPKNLQADVAWSVLQGMSKDTGKVLPLMDMLVDGGAWDRVESQETTYRIQQLVREGNAAEVAQWATTMPVRKETSELFYRSVDTYLRDNPDTAREWIAGIEDSAWRDRAYMEYSQQSLNAHKDPAASRWALNQVSDSKLKAQAEGWRAQWEAKNPGK